MGHYASEMQAPLSKEQQRIHSRYRRLEEKIRDLPLSCISIGEFGELQTFRDYGLRRGDSWDETRAKFWRKKIKEFDKLKRL